jgi:O-antigen/teichoic acid export membrane protein
MIVGIGRIDIIFIEKFANKTDLALFSSALNIYQVSQLFFFAVITSQFLILIKNKSYIIKYLIPVLIIVIVIVIFISRYFYLYLFPEEYFNGYIVLNYIVLALFPSVLNYYFITRNNYNDQVKANFFILFIFLMIKIGIYQFLRSADLSTYYTIFPIIEAGILITYLMYMKFYESTPNK